MVKPKHPPQNNFSNEYPDSKWLAKQFLRFHSWRVKLRIFLIYGNLYLEKVLEFQGQNFVRKHRVN